MKQSNKVGLIILDGWGQGAPGKQNAIDQANTPYVDLLLDKYPNASLLTDGEHVGLPSGQMGNSEVGHMNIGAGRIVYQDLLRRDRAISSGEFFKNEALKKKLMPIRNKLKINVNNQKVFNSKSELDVIPSKY